METISSGRTFVMKRVFPVFWFGFLALFLLLVVFTGAFKKDVLFLVIPLAMALFGLALMRALIWDLADEVKDGGDFLLVRRGRIEERVQLGNVVNVGMSQFTNPPRLSLRLRTAGQLGDEVVFIPRGRPRLNPFARNELAEQLLQRVERLRNRGANR